MQTANCNRCALSWLEIDDTLKVQALQFDGLPILRLRPGPLKCFCAPRRQNSAKSAPQKARNRNKAKFETKLRKLRRDCVNMNNEE